MPKPSTKSWPLLLCCLAWLGGCQKQPADFITRVQSPNGKRTATIEEYQSQGMHEGGIAVSISPSMGKDGRALTIGAARNLRIGWIADDKLAITYSGWEDVRLKSPIYTSRETASHVDLILCNDRDLDCTGLKTLMAARRAYSLQRFRYCTDEGAGWGCGVSVALRSTEAR